MLYQKRFDYDQRTDNLLFKEVNEQEEKWLIEGILVMDDLHILGKYDVECDSDYLGVLYLQNIFSNIDYDALEYDIK